MQALLKYAGAVPLQVAIMSGALALLGQGAEALEAAQNLPGGIQGSDAAKVGDGPPVGIWMLAAAAVTDTS
jgi:hypothetical protein